MDNIVKLREQLSEVFNELKDGNLKPGIATEMNNAAGKIINSLKVELEYHKLRKQPPQIDFFEEK